MDRSRKKRPWAGAALGLCCLNTVAAAPRGLQEGDAAIYRTATSCGNAALKDALRRLSAAQDAGDEDQVAAIRTQALGEQAYRGGCAQLAGITLERWDALEQSMEAELARGGTAGLTRITPSPVITPNVARELNRQLRSLTIVWQEEQALIRELGKDEPTEAALALKPSR